MEESIFRFEHPLALWAWLLVPVLIGLFILSGYLRNQAIKRWGEWGTIQQLMPLRSPARRIIKAILYTLAFAVLVPAIANPQLGSKLKTAKRKGAELIIALDVSNSMMAEDIRPNRLSNASQAIAQLLKRLKGDKVGLVVFAGDAYVQIPITTDYSAAKMFLRTVETNMVPIQGTAIGKAIRLAMNSFTDSETASKAIILISDGENHEDDAILASEEATELGMTVHAIGMGSPEGEPIPVYDPYGRKTFRKDQEGNTVVTKLNEAMLREVAAAGNGVYVRATNANTGLNILMDEIEKMEREEFETQSFSEYESRFQIFVFIVIVLLLLEFIILPRRNKWLVKLGWFKFLEE